MKLKSYLMSTTALRSPEGVDGGGGGDAAAAPAVVASDDVFDGGDAAEGEANQSTGKEANAAASSDADDEDVFSADGADENQDGGSADEAGSEQEGEDGGDEVPDQYAAFELPEGFDVNEEALGNFSEMAKSDKLSQEQAQKYVDLFTGELQAAVKAGTDAQAKAWEDQTAGFSKASREAGLLKPEVLSMANAGVKAADPTGELGFLLKTLGLNKHQAVLRAFSHYGKETSNDREVPSSGQSGQDTKNLAAQYQNAFSAKP